ncbi:MAG: hypothetical protein VB081_08340 [Christensenella sp.]|uniref:hypothetical protein n=1 Tax=Christensenella sp. TaxID=1935934 RepID=UPI002B207CB7|nr:hypothetical protein [Christensenella sp.]MEA5003492.1 hypothetical protein [Christensenella sp.]
MKQQSERFAYKLDARIQELRKERNTADAIQTVAPPVQKDTVKSAGMVYNTGNGIKADGSASIDSKGIAQPMSAMVSDPPQATQELKANALPVTTEGIRDYLKAHPDETIHGVNAAMLDGFEGQLDEIQKNGPQLSKPPQPVQKTSEIDWTQEYDPQPSAEPPQPKPKTEGTISNEANNKTQYTDWEKLKNDPVSSALAPMIGEAEKALKGALNKGEKPDGTPIYQYKDWSDEDVRVWYATSGSTADKLNEISAKISGVETNPDIKGIGEAVYLSEEDAAKAFAGIAKNKPDWATNEYAAMMVTVKVPQTDPTGKVYVAERTLLLPAIEGGASNVIVPVVEQYLKFAGLVTSEAGIPVTGVSFIHSHPSNGGGIVDEFSNGDRIVGMMPGVANMYRVNGDSGQIWRYNEWEEQMYGKDKGYWKKSRGYLYNNTYNGVEIN